MSIERLEEIELEYSTLTVSSERNGIEYTEVDVNDLVFLIQNSFKQAKRIEELEDIIYQDERQAVLKALYEQNKRYREALEEIRGLYPLRNLGYQVSEIRKIVVKALEGEE